MLLLLIHRPIPFDHDSVSSSIPVLYAMLIPISLVIPSYNRAHLIAETLDSALAQTTPFAEIIVIDDGSTDNTCDIVERYAGRVRLIRSANSGVQSARNKGVAAAVTDYVTLCDSDDLLEPDFVTTMVNWLASHDDIDVVYVNIRRFRAGEIEPDHLSLGPAGFLEGATSSGDFYCDIPEL